MINITLNKIDTLDSKMDEAFKQLRTNLIFCGEDVKKILVTSCVANEGKSEVSFNLARSLAEAGNRVMLVDCDIRRSVMRSRFQIEEKVNGLSHYLAGRSALNDILCQTNVQNLYMILAGTSVPNPAELLGSKRFPAMMESLKTVFDYIILDSPPLGVVIDAAIIAPNADGAVLVIESNAVSYKVAQNVKAQLDKSECRILGAVINKAERSDKKSKYGRYYGYYGGYGAYGGYGGYIGDDDGSDQKKKTKTQNKA